MRRNSGGRPWFRWVLWALALMLCPPLPPAVRGALGILHSTYCVRMRDGATLPTDVYLPRIPLGPVPVILVRTPYGRDKVPRTAALLVCHAGRALVVQDMRQEITSAPDSNAPDSEAWASERRDGHDTLRWIACQPWCDGNVGSWGPSALGITQNLYAVDAPSVLRAQYVSFAASNLYAQVAYQGGAYRQELLQGWSQRYGYKSTAPAFREHHMYDAFWEAMNAEAQAARVNVPAVYVGGWYDVFLQGTINSFMTVQTEGGPRARGHCRLIIGPWIHDDSERLSRPKAIRQLPVSADPFRCMDYWLKGTPSGVPCDRPVVYCVMGARGEACAPGNFWRAADRWPPESLLQSYYFHRDGSLRTGLPASNDAVQSFRYDPEHPVPTRGGQNMYLARGPWDQRGVESRSDVLLFTTDALTSPTEVTGRLLAALYVSSDCPDTDFTVKLTDVYPDGRSILIADGIQRARFRESFSREEFMHPGEVYKLTIDMWSTSYIFNTGHRIRIAVSSSNAPRFEPNSNTGAAHYQQGATRVATNSVHLSDRYPSQIVLPVHAGRP